MPFISKTTAATTRTSNRPIKQQHFFPNPLRHPSDVNFVFCPPSGKLQLSSSFSAPSCLWSYHSLTKSPSLPVGLIAPVAPKLIVCLLYSAPLCIHLHLSYLYPPFSLPLQPGLPHQALTFKGRQTSLSFPTPDKLSTTQNTCFPSGHRHLYIYTSFHVSCMYVLFFPETVNSLRARASSFFFFLASRHVGILVPQREVKPMPPALETQS